MITTHVHHEITQLRASICLVLSCERWLNSNGLTYPSSLALMISGLINIPGYNAAFEQIVVYRARQSSKM